MEKGHGLAKKGFFGWFNRFYDRGAGRYQRVVECLLRRRVRGVIAYAVLVVLLGVLFIRLPTGFLPQEDQGLMYAQVILPPGSTLEMTKKVLARVSDHLLTEEKEAIESVMSIAGFNFGSRGQNAGVAFIRLKPWDERPGARLRADTVAARAQKAFAGDQGGERLRLHAAGGHRAGQRHRLRAAAPGPRPAWGTTRCWRRATSSSTWPARIRASPRSAPPAWRTRRSSTWTWTSRRRSRWASRSPT